MTQRSGDSGQAEVDPRVARTREVVVAAAVEELIEVGFDRVSIDAIAERSGVARSTIYRNWPDRSELLAQAFRRACHEPPTAELVRSGRLRVDLEQLAQRLVAKLRSEEWARTVPSLIGAAIHDEPIRALAASFSSERHSEARAVLIEAAERGEITRPEEIDSALERFVGPFFFRRLVSQLPLDEDLIRSQVEATLRQLGVEVATLAEASGGSAT